MTESNWERVERSWLNLLLSPDRTPNRDPFHEMVMGLSHLTGSRRGVGERPVSQIKLSPSAWEVIWKSPLVPADPDRGPSTSFSNQAISILGTPVVIDDRLPEGVIAFLADDGEVVRMVVLTDSPNQDNP